MKNKLLFVLLLLVLMACGGVKKTQEALGTGNYAAAIDRSIKGLVGNKDKKGNQPYVLLLEEAFQKYTKRELEQIKFLEREKNPANYEVIYKAYGAA